MSARPRTVSGKGAMEESQICRKFIGRGAEDEEHPDRTVWR